MYAAAPRLGEILLAERAIDALQLNAALGHQRRWGGKLGKILVTLGFTSERAVVRALSRQLGVPMVDLSSQAVSPAVLSKVPVEICRRHRLLPLAIRRDERGPFLHVAMADPSNLEAIDDLGFLTGLRVEAAVAPEGEIDRAIARHYRAEGEASFSEPFEVRGEGSEGAEVLRFGDPFGEPGAARTTGGGPAALPEPSPGNQPPASNDPPPGERRANGPLDGDAPRDLFSASDPAYRAVEALVRILVRKGILEKGEFLQEILRDVDGELRN